MVAGILAFLQAIPALIGLCKELFAYFQQVKAQGKADDVVNFILNSTKVVQQIKEAKSDEEKKAAAKSVHDLIGQL